jgi:hypothetical protein
VMQFGSWAKSLKRVIVRSGNRAKIFPRVRIRPISRRAMLLVGGFDRSGAPEIGVRCTKTHFCGMSS